MAERKRLRSRLSKWLRIPSRHRDSGRSTPEPSIASQEPEPEDNAQERNDNSQETDTERTLQNISSQDEAEVDSRADQQEPEDIQDSEIGFQAPQERLWDQAIKNTSSQEDEAEAEVDQNVPEVVQDPEIECRSLQERLWDQAYEQAKESDSKIVEAYEKIISHNLGNQTSSSIDVERPSNHQTEPTTDERRRNMRLIVQAGLERTKKEAKIKTWMGENLKTINVLRKSMDQVVRSAPEAAVAWAGVCFGLEILSSPITEATVNREGIGYVVSRMDWYWHLSDLLLPVNRGEAWSAALQEQLEKQIIDLYKKLLLYQMKSVCLYYRSKGMVFLRDLIKLDDWDGQLTGIRVAEAAVKTDSELFNTSAIRQQLDSIAISGDEVQKKLGSILSAIENQNAQQQVTQRTKEEEDCLKAMRVTDPRLDKTRIENTNGGLLQDSYLWILENEEFVSWKDHLDSRLLWIKGDPGKGKTMLLCGIINELQKSVAARTYYFFCQATDPRLNNATGVLCGLIYSIACEHREALLHAMKKYKQAGEGLFRDVNSWIALSEILTSILQDPSFKDKIIIIDALDECATNRDRLLDFIIQASTKSEVRWIVSSRNWTDIEEKLDTSSQRMRLSLEINEQSISDAVRVYINHKVNELARLKKLDDNTRAAIRGHLSAHANGTFLWVALVYKELSKGETRRRHMLEAVQKFPSGLGPLYTRMLEQVRGLKDADLCIQILGLVSLVYRPLSLMELKSLIETLDDIGDYDELRDVISSCGSFLVLRNDVVYFVHQSAKDFLLKQASDQIFASGIAHRHQDICLRSLKIMSSTLRHDVYKICHPGALVSEICPPNPDPLAAVRYSCEFWVDHLRGAEACERNMCEASLQDEGVVHGFLKVHLLHWLEAFSLMGRISEAILAIRTLETLTMKILGPMSMFIKDAHRFVLLFRGAIEASPLQIYTSGLIFAPTSSIVRKTFEPIYSPRWIVGKPIVQLEWNACLQTLEGHRRFIFIADVVFSPDGTQLASASDDKTVKIWDRVTGACLQTLEHEEAVKTVAFSLNGMKLASASRNCINIWNLTSAGYVLRCACNWYNYDDGHPFLSFSPDGGRLTSSILWRPNDYSDDAESEDYYSGDAENALKWQDRLFQVWDSATGRQLKTQDYYPEVKLTAVCEASKPADKIVILRDPITGSCAQFLNSILFTTPFTNNIAFSLNGEYVALACQDGTIAIMSTATGAYLQKLDCTGGVCSLAFSQDGGRLASGFKYRDCGIKVYDVATGVCLHTLPGHTSSVRSVTFSPDGAQLASSSLDTVKIWDLTVGALADEQKSEPNGYPIDFMTYSQDKTQLATVKSRWMNPIIEIWDVTTGICLQTLRDFENWLDIVAFSSNGKQLVSTEHHGGRFDALINVKVWDPTTGDCQHEFHDELLDSVISMAFSPDSTQLALAEAWKTIITLWDMINITRIHVLRPESNTKAVVFSSDGMRLGSLLGKGVVQIWDLTTGSRLQRLEIPDEYSASLGELPGLRYLKWQHLVANILQNQNSACNFLYDFFSKENDAWILRRQKPFLWLPSEYRPWAMSFSGEHLAISYHDQLLFFRFSLPDLDAWMA